MDYAIPIGFTDLVRYYPEVYKTPPHTVSLRDDASSLRVPGKRNEWVLDQWTTELAGTNAHYTTCCIQMSHAINMAFYTRDPAKMVGQRSRRAQGEPGRPNHSAVIPVAGNRRFHYVASVDEMKEFLTDTFGTGEEISGPKDVGGRPGILVFMNHKRYGEHTEIWDGLDFHQDWMIRQKSQPFNWKPVWFWGVIPDVPII